MLNDLFKQVWFWIILFLVVVVLFLSMIGIIPWYGILEQTGMIGPVILFIIWVIPTLWGLLVTMPAWLKNPENPWLILVGIILAVVALFVGLGYSNIMEWWMVGVILAVLALATIWGVGLYGLFNDLRARSEPKSHTGTKPKRPGA